MTLTPLARTHTSRQLIPSLALHGLILAVILHHRHIFIAPMKLPGDLRGSHVSLTYTPGRSAPQAAMATPWPRDPSRATPNPLVAPHARPTQQAATSTQPGSNKSAAPQGTDAFGSGNATVALATFFPRPRPDLPAHTRGDVIVDVVIDETGKITDTKVAQSLGPAVDQAVLATIQTWTFTPATRDGKPVASEQELLFHYERG